MNQANETNPVNQANKKIIGLAIVLFSGISIFTVGLVAGVMLYPSVGQASNTGAGWYDQNYVDEVYKLLSQNYLGELPAKQDATYGIVKGLFGSLEDEYSAFLTPNETEEYFKGADSVYEGIGLYLGFDGQNTIVETPIENHPAQKAGIRTGDVVTEVDGQDVTSQRPELVAPKIRGKAGTKVKLKIYRESSKEILDFEVERKEINLENISYEEVAPGIYKIDIVKFTEGDEGLSSGVQVFNRQWEDAVNGILAKSPKGIILDLRNNPGGYVESAKYVAEEFLQDDTLIMQEQEKGKEPEHLKAKRTGRFVNIPSVVLINSGSASASEIVSGALQDNNKAKIVGEESLGKGVEQRLLQVRKDEALMIIVFKKWLTPKGKQVSKDSAIIPDVVVKFEQKEGQKYDEQVRAAVEQLKK